MTEELKNKIAKIVNDVYTLDEMKNRISMALKDPILQQGFEIICKEIVELEQKLEQTEKDLADYQFNYPKIKELSKENKHLKEEMEIMTNFCGACKKKHEEENNKLLDVINNQDVKIADLEQDLKHKKIAIQTRNKRIADLEKKIEKMKCCGNCRYNSDMEEGIVYQECIDCDGKCNWKLEE